MLPIALSVLACRDPAPPPRVDPGPPRSIDGADAFAAADLDGDGVDELLRVVDGQLHWTGGVQELGGGFQRAVRADLDGDGREEALIATGLDREHRGAAARLWQVDQAEASLIWERPGARGQVPELRVIDGRIWLAAYGAGLTIESGWLDQGELSVEHAGQLAARTLPTDEGLLVGRIYGDEPKSDGDLRLHQGDEVQALPSFRGVRALERFDLDGDEVPEILIGDGWHYAYGTQAVARVQLLDGSDPQRNRTIGFLAGDYAVEELWVVDGEVLAQGARTAWLLRHEPLGWRGIPLGEQGEQGNIVPLTTEEGAAVALSGDPGSLVLLEAR